MLHELGFECWILELNGSQCCELIGNTPSGLPQTEAASGFKGDALLGSVYQFSNLRRYQQV